MFPLERVEQQCRALPPSIAQKYELQPIGLENNVVHLAQFQDKGKMQLHHLKTSIVTLTPASMKDIVRDHKLALVAYPLIMKIITSLQIISTHFFYCLVTIASLYIFISRRTSQQRQSRRLKSTHSCVKLAENSSVLLSCLQNKTQIVDLR